jgi:hypothetical protein
MKKLLVAAALALLGIGGLAIAQTPVPKVTNVGPTDVFSDIVGGVAGQSTKYATAAQITNVPGYKYLGTITTDPAYTFVNGQTNLSAHAAGTISTVTLTTPPNPADGARICYILDQTTSTLTWTANTGQTIGANVPASGVAKNPNCLVYQASSTTWFISP